MNAGGCARLQFDSAGISHKAETMQRCARSCDRRVQSDSIGANLVVSRRICAVMQHSCGEAKRHARCGEEIDKPRDTEWQL